MKEVWIQRYSLKVGDKIFYRRNTPSGPLDLPGVVHGFTEQGFRIQYWTHPTVSRQTSVQPHSVWRRLTPIPGVDQ